MVSPYTALTFLSLWYWLIPETNARHPTCLAIEGAIPTAYVSYPGSPFYTRDTYHWLPSSSQASACSVEPATVQDVSKILQILGNNSTPFAVKGGGRATNPGFSSTPGVQIALSKFKDVTYDPKLRTATVGAGLAWDEVYTRLQPLGVTVVGGRIVGVGMAGVTLGGGYSYTSNRHGLVIDNIVAFELVLPNGEITTVTADSNPELSFALKGGYNNFGIVTHFVLKTYSLHDVWGGDLLYTGANIGLVVPAIADFQASNTDVDATVVAVYARMDGAPPFLSVTAFYNGSTPPPGVFDNFFSIPRTLEDVKTRTYTDLINTASVPFLHNKLRGAMHTVSLTDLSVGVISQILNQTDFYYNYNGSFTSGASLMVFIEPFIPTGGVTSPNSDTAYPHTKFLTPLSLLWRWPDADSDQTARENLKLAAAAITATAESEGQKLADLPLYSDYSLSDIPLEKLYTVNLPKLRSIRAKYDPNKMMDRAGGFHF